MSKLLVWSLVASVLFASLPIPIAVVSHNDSDDQQNFPCRDGKCGCKSAFQCWTSCCCHTPQERLDWAARNKVQVPEYGQHLKQIVAQQKSQPRAAKQTCCQKPHEAVVADKPACCAPKAKAAEKAVASKPRVKVVLSMFALGCRGSSGELASLPWAVVHVREVTPLVLGLFEHELKLLDINGPVRFYPPELPPPRLS